MAPAMHTWRYYVPRHLSFLLIDYQNPTHPGRRHIVHGSNPNLAGRSGNGPSAVRAWLAGTTIGHLHTGSIVVLVVVGGILRLLAGAGAAVSPTASMPTPPGVDKQSIESYVSTMRLEEATRERIVDAAGQLFAARGFDDVSLREINRMAGTNVAAIHYHFGSKEALLRAVLDRVVGPITEARVTALDAALRASDGEPLDVRTIVVAFVGPDFDAIEHLRQNTPEIAGLLARTYAAPTPFVQAIMREQFASCAARFYPELARALPNLSLDEIQARMQLVVGVLIGLFAATGAGTGDEDPRRAMDRVVAFASAGLSAPAPSAPACPRRRSPG